MPKIKAPARMENLERLLEFVSAQAQRAGFSKERGGQVRLAAEEALVNVMSYAYPDGSGDLDIDCASSDGVLTMKIGDKGIVYNPLAVSRPTTGASLDDRDPGGLGIYLIKKMATRVRYKRENGENRLILVFAASP